MALTEGKDTPVDYELIGLVVSAGRDTGSGHYFSYILHSSNEWYKLDDTPTGVKEPVPPATKVTAFEVLSHANNAYIFFYRKSNTKGSIPKNIIAWL